MPSQSRIQIHETPRVLPKEKECQNCIHFVGNIDPRKTIGWCQEQQEPTTNYDECGAFSERKES